MSVSAKQLGDRVDKLILDELTHEEGFFGKEGSIMLQPKEKSVNEEGLVEGQEAAADGENAVEEGEGDDQEKQPQPLQFQYRTLKEYMVSTIDAIKVDINLQMEKHENYLTETTNKFELVDKRVDVDIEAILQDLKMQADGVE